MTKFNSWTMHKHRKLTAKKQEEQVLLKLAEQGNKLAIRKLKKDHNIVYWQEAC